MNPELAQELMQLPQGRALRDFLAAEARKLDSVQKIHEEHPFAIAVETKARLRAYETVMHMLDPLLNYQEPTTIKTTDNEYAVEV